MPWADVRATHPAIPLTVAGPCAPELGRQPQRQEKRIAEYLFASYASTPPQAAGAVPSAETAWLSPFITDIWRYFKLGYGSCAVSRTLPAPIGPGCEWFGAPKPLIAFLHRDTAPNTNDYALRFDELSGFRNTIDIGSQDWSAGNGLLRDQIVHLACFQVEVGSQGVLGSPAYTVWGNSKWAEFCKYDFYARTGRTADAQRVFNESFKNRDNLPPGAANVAWFRDWLFPLWRDNGSNPDVMERFFGLLSTYFPKRPKNGGRNMIYSRGMTTGEYVHFMSGAAGLDLSARAASAFNTGFNRAEFEKAKADFPNITYKPAIATPTGMITGIGGKCVDISGAHTANGTAIQLYTCNGTDAQRWTVGTRRTPEGPGQVCRCNRRRHDQWGEGPALRLQRFRRPGLAAPGQRHAA